MQPDFRSLSLSPDLLSVVGELGYHTPTPIQAESIPVMLARKDLIGQSKTGSGKTAAFGLPVLQNLDMATVKLQALVVCPTRELCAQVARELRTLGRRQQGLQVLVLAGGEPIRPQLAALARGVHLVVGTPGRLLDHLKRTSLDTSAISTVVLDEADRMLDMGFLPDMETLLAALPASRQTALFSATFPPAVEQLCRVHQRDAVRVCIREAEQERPELQQLVVTVSPENKLRSLYWVLDKYACESALIFCNFKATVAALDQELMAAGASVDCLHGDLEQFQRDQVLARFRNHSVRILIATDVAGRGLDVEDLELVVNYELPPQPDVYVHRVGRTGRAGKHGLAVSLATAREGAKLDAIAQRTGVAIDRVVVPRAAEPEEIPRAVARRAAMGTILISGGRKDKVRPGDILGALTGEAGGLDASSVGKIEIHDRLSYVAVSADVSRSAVQALNRGRIKGKRFRASLVERAPQQRR